MINVSFRQLLDSVGFTNALDAGNNQSTVKNVLSIDPVREAAKNRIKTDFAKNAMSDLTINIADKEFITVVYRAFETFVTAEEQIPVIDHPSKANLRAQEVDHFITLLETIRDFTKDQTLSDSTSAGIQFAHNIETYIIELTDADVAALNERELGILAIADITPELIVPQSSVFVADSRFADRAGRTKFPTYTGVDMRVIFMTPHAISKNITVKVLSYSMHSGLIPVSTLGRKQPKGFAEGDTTIAGSIIATVSINDPLFDMQPMNYAVEDYAKRSSDVWKTYLLPDQFPLFDILLAFSNEQGFTSSMAIFGVKLTDVGSVMSMSDSEIEVTYTYTALDIELLRSLSGEQTDANTDTFDILGNNEYLARRKMAYDGKSEHRDHFEVGSIYGAIDRRMKEFGYNQLRMKGYSITDVYNEDRKI